MNNESHRLAGSSHGFTLIELLVVMLVIGLLSSTLVLTVTRAPADERELDMAAHSLVSVLRQASSEAVLRGQALGLQLVPPAHGRWQDRTRATWTFRWLHYSQPRQQIGSWETSAISGQWSALSSERRPGLLADMSLPEGMVVSLTIDGQAVDVSKQFSVDTDTSGDNSMGQPAMVFYPTGDVNSFELGLHYEGNGAANGVRISNLRQGRIERLP